MSLGSDFVMRSRSMYVEWRNLLFVNFDNCFDIFNKFIAIYAYHSTYTLQFSTLIFFLRNDYYSSLNKNREEEEDNNKV